MILICTRIETPDGPLDVEGMYYRGIPGIHSGHPDGWTPDEPPYADCIRAFGPDGEPPPRQWDREAAEQAILVKGLEYLEEPSGTL